MSPLRNSITYCYHWITFNCRSNAVKQLIVMFVVQLCHAVAAVVAAAAAAELITVVLIKPGTWREAETTSRRRYLSEWVFNRRANSGWAAVKTHTHTRQQRFLFKCCPAWVDTFFFSFFFAISCNIRSCCATVWPLKHSQTDAVLHHMCSKVRVSDRRRNRTANRKQTLP